MRIERKLLCAFLVSALACAIDATAYAQAKPKAQPPTKGQAQLNGLNAQFGVIYTLSNHFNFEILKARYTLDPFLSYGHISARTDEKLLVVDIAIKNVATGDNFFNNEGFMTAVDEKGQLYNFGSGALALLSMGRKSPNTSLKPGQGLGQPALKDPLQMGVEVPSKARIVKLIVNTGRLGSADKVMRYYIAGATKEEAGEAGNPANVIAPLPENVRDHADKSGAVALAEGVGKVGEYEPSRDYGLRLEGVAVSTDKFRGEPAPAGKKYVVATFTAKMLVDDQGDMFYVEGANDSVYGITDTDGERYRPIGFRKAGSDEDADHKFQLGDEYKFRIFFVVPQNASLKKMIVATSGGPRWAYDVSGVK